MPSGMREGFISTSYSEDAPTRWRDQPFGTQGRALPAQ